MKNIDIPKPCSESWNEMSPTEKGAFCQKCAIDVYDFTNKSGDEIRDILKLNIGSRVCGRIAPQQLDKLNDDFLAWKMSSKQSFNRAWIFSLIVVFGLTLFSCEEDEEPVVKEIQRTAQTLLSQTSEPEGTAMFGAEKLGESMSKEDQVKPLDKLAPQAPIEYIPECVIEITGEVEITEEPIVQEYIKGDMEYHYVEMLGGLSWSEAYVESIETSIEPVEVELSGLVYPNPAQNQSTLKVTLPEAGMTEILLFSMNGQQLKTIHSGRMEAGDSEFQMNIADLETGTYLVVIVSEGNKETVKFSKI